MLGYDRTRPFSKHVLLIGLVATLLYTACSDRGRIDREELLQDLPPELVQHLISSDDSTLARYAREMRYEALVAASLKLDDRVRRMWLENRVREASVLLAYSRRLARIRYSEFEDRIGILTADFIDTISADRRRAFIKLYMEYDSLYHERDLAAEVKLERFLRFMNAFEAYGYRPAAANCKWRLSFLYEAIGNDQEQVKYLRAALADFAEIGNPNMTCQALGVLGSIYESSGKIDSMVICYEEAKRIANRCRLPIQAPRICSFYAGHYIRKGRFSLAHNLLKEAMELCREYRGGATEIRFIFEAMRFYADLGCWEPVDRLLMRARILEREFENIDFKFFEEVHKLRIDQIEAQMRLAKGDIKEAEAILQRIMKNVEEFHPPYSYRAERVKPLYYWAEGFLANGHAQEALDIARDGFRRSKEVSILRWSARFALLVARAAFELGEVQESEWALQQFDHLALESQKPLKLERIMRDALLGKIKLRRGDMRGATLALEEGLARLKGYVMNIDAGVHGYLWIGECEGLRQLMHDLVANDPSLGYAAELFWRDFYRLLDSQSREGDRKDTDLAHRPEGDASSRGRSTYEKLADLLRARAEAARKRIEELGAIHSIYIVRNSEIWRWTATPKGIRREIIGASTSEVRDLVAKSWETMSSDFAEPDMSRLSAVLQNLRALALLLLPPEVLHATAKRSETTFLVTADGFLNRIPFEAFDIGEGGEYIPLLRHRDIAYLRHADPPTNQTATDPGVIIVNERLSETLSNRYPFQQELQEVLAEGESVALLNPSARFLSGESATKSNLLSIWGNASFVYMATHTLRDPQVPYLMLIPLATPGDVSGPDAAYLDITDIRAADLSKCDIVVLSGCSSGAPYVGARNFGPSLGDAFLDAGAAAVVQSFWDVRDEEARMLMTRYIQSWGTQGTSKIQAFCNARRTALQPPEGARNPFSWAAFSIEIGKL